MASIVKLVGKGIVGRMKVKKEGRAEVPLQRLGRPFLWSGYHRSQAGWKV